IDVKKRGISAYDTRKRKNGDILKVLKRYLKKESRTKDGTKINLTVWTAESLTNISTQAETNNCGVFMRSFV
ncbi:hypothetical protein K501DRAFT_193623, partial [Backusella circina FSU 941]